MQWSIIRQRLTADRRLTVCCAMLGALFSAVTVTGCELRKYGVFRAGCLLPGMAIFVLLGVLFFALAFALFSLCDLQRAREFKPERLLSRISGNGFLIFLLLCACWIPVWLAFWPGNFSADSLTQFYSYYNEEPYAHHPLVHTALLGFCMMLGIDLHPEGYATWGLAIYCGVQLVLLAACIAYACWWMKRRRVPVWARLAVTLLFALCPFYTPWVFCAQKDVLFAALVTVFCLQLADLWKYGMKPVRLIFFILIGVLMMLLRNNGVYALALLLPFGIWWAKGRRIRMGALLAVCMALYLAVNGLMISKMEATTGSKVEILSIPLQQIARTLRDDPAAIELDEDGVLETLYGENDLAGLYHAQIADPVKWAIDYDLLDENIPSLLKLWARMGVGHLKTYVEAFMVQNLPYILPYSDMLYNFDMTVHQIDYFPIEQNSLLPELNKIYMEYDKTLSFMGIPGTRLLSEPAFFVWLCVAGLAYALCRREYGLTAAFGMLLAVWFTCLLGPVAIMRYVLSLYYAVPVLWGCLLIPGGFERR
ncbi:MAG: hypothetical protein IJ354_08590 [Clostridia bacterium]|nr:hypothetical protein [Clostridia bacterium]